VSGQARREERCGAIGRAAQRTRRPAHGNPKGRSGRCAPAASKGLPVAPLRAAPFSWPAHIPVRRRRFRERMKGS